MPRKGFIAKRDVLPDPLYNSKVVTKLVNNIMLDGKKSVAQNIVYGAFEIIKEKEQKDPLEVFEAALENIMPVLEVKARRIGGATYQVPMEIRADRKQTLAIRWLVEYARKNNLPEMIRPSDFKSLKDSNIIYEGLLKNYQSSARKINENLEEKLLSHLKMLQY